MDIDEWVRKDASIPELRAMLDAVTTELARRSYVCGECGRDIPQALSAKHPDHDKRSCSRYASMVTY